MKLKIIWTIVAVIFCLSGCYEDKGNYRYLEQNQVAISIPMEANAYVDELFTCVPEVTYAHPDRAPEVELWWEYTQGPEGLSTKETIIQKGKDLNYTPTVIGDHNLRLYAKEVATGIMYSKEIKLKVGAPYSKGWAILSNDGGKSVLSYIRPQWQNMDGVNERVYTAFPNIFEMEYPGETLGNNPIQLRQLLSGDYDGGGLIYILQESGTLSLRGATYQKERLLTAEFESVPAGFALRDFFTNSVWGHILVLSATGECYTKSYNSPMFSTLFPAAALSYQEVPINASAVVSLGDFYSAFYGIVEEVNKRIIWYDGAFANALIPCNYLNPPVEYFDVNNFGDATLIYCSSNGSGDWNARGATSMTILYSRNGTIYLQRCFFGQYSEYGRTIIPISNVESKPFAGAAHITSSTKFYHLAHRPYLFYATGNVLYWCDLSTGVCRQFHVFPDGETIVDMDSNPGNKELGVVLKSGTFVTFDITNEMLIKGRKIYEYNGIPGEIVDVEYKYPNNMDYLFQEVD